MKYDDNLKEFIKNILNKYRFQFGKIISKYHEDIKIDIYNLTDFLDETAGISERLYCILNEIHEVKLCPICNKNKLTYKNYNIGYIKHCSLSCSKNDNETKLKYKKTYKEKYGIDVDSNFKLPGYYENVKKVVMEKYGVENVSQIDSVKNKKRNTFQKNNNSPHPKWGNTWYDYKLPNGKYVKVQGYERFALPYLLEKYELPDILISYKDIISRIGEIIYKYDDKKYRYYPDFYIIPDNKIIEVKSLFTLKQHIDNTLLKKKKCEELGFNFEIMIFNYKGDNITNEEIGKIIK